MTTPEPGIYERVPHAVYQRWNATSRSDLVKLADTSPLHAIYERENPTPPSDPMLIGLAIHTLILEPDKFESEYAYGPAGRRGGEWKAFVAECRERGVVPLHPDYHKAGITGAVASLRHPRNAAAMRYLTTPGRSELSIVWRDPATGMLCKGRPDRQIATVHGPALLDLKKTRDASAAGFARAIADYRLHLQVAHYLSGYEVLTGEKCDTFIWIAVEDTPPYGVGIYFADPDRLAEHRAEWRELMDRWAECEASGEWPGYSAIEAPIGPPAYYNPYRRRA